MPVTIARRAFRKGPTSESGLVFSLLQFAGDPNGRVANEVCQRRIGRRMPTHELPNYWTPEQVRQTLAAMPVGRP